MESDPTAGEGEVGDQHIADRHADDIAALHAVASLAPGDPDDRLILLLEAGCAALDADRGFVLLRTGPELSVRVVAGPRGRGEQDLGPVRDRRVDDVLARQVTVATLGGPAAADGGTSLGTGPLVACPMWVTGRVAGAIAFTCDTPRDPFSAWQLAVVDLVADGASRVLEHEADIRALVRLEAQSRAMISVIPDPVVRVHRDGHRVGDEGETLGVFDPCAPARRTGEEPDEGTLLRVRQAVAMALDTGELQTDEYASGPELRARRFEARYVPSGPHEVLCIVRDITERHRAEVALAEQVAFEALATSVSTQLIGCAPNELDHAIEVGLGEIATFFGADLAYIHELAADGATLRVSHQWARGPEEPARHVGDVVDVAGFQWLTARFERDGHVFSRGPASVPEDAMALAITGDGEQGGLWVRLGYGGELMGVLGLAWSTYEPPDSDEVLGLVRFAADAFVGAIRRRSVALLAEDQAQVFELIARGAPLSTAMLGARELLHRHTLGITVLVATVDDDHLTLVAANEEERAWEDWFAAVEPSLATPFGQAVVSGEPVLVADVVGDPRFGAGALPSERFRSASIEPVRSPRNGRTLAVVALLGTERGAPQARPEVRDTARALITVAVERAEDERRLAHQATHDPLTGVGNRAALLDRLELALARARRTGRAVAVLYCDLDGFKSVNDQYGHDRGDRLLVEVASRISQAVRPSDTVCRTGGDEFVIVCEDLLDPVQAQAIVERVRTNIELVPVDIGETTLPVTASVGMAMADEGEADADRVLRAADLAMYATKQRRRTAAMPRAVLGQDEAVIDLRDQATRSLADDLGAALADGRSLYLAHQPLVGRDGTLTGVEVLVRWEHPTLGEVGAGTLLQAAALDPGLAVELGRWVRTTGFAQRAGWLGGASGVARAPLHVNVSGTELVAAAFIPGLLADLEQAGVGLDEVVVEVAERDLANPGARAAVAQLAREGVAVLVEDAGLGGMPLPDLAELAVRGIKISRSLVGRIEEDDPLGVEVVRSLVLLAHGLGWRSVGVGVETDHQRAVLFGFGVQAVQGRAITMPVSAEDLRHWLGNRGTKS